MLNGFHAYHGTAMMGVEVQNSAIKKNQELTYQTPCHAVVDYCDDKRMKKLENQLAGARAAGRKGLPIGAIKGSEKPGAYRILYAADTLEELASYMYEDEEIEKTFLSTVKCYNEMCRAGRDTEFGKEPALLHEIRKAPFYAVGQPKDSHHPIGQSFKLLVTVRGL